MAFVPTGYWMSRILCATGRGVTFKISAPLDEVMNRRQVLVAVGSSALVATSGCAEIAETLFTPAFDVDPRVVEEHIFEMVNDERTTHSGNGPLEHDQGAAETARAHAEDMAENDYYSHTAQDGETAEERWSFCRGGENIAFRHTSHIETQTDKEAGQEELARQFVDSWMNSEGHRENILRDVYVSTGVGIGIAEDETVYGVQGFCTE